MEAMIAVCGLKCSDCEAYIATQQDDDAKRAEVAENWSKMFNADLKAEDITCDGCIAENGRHFSHCNVCEIRACGIEKGLKSCAFCSDYICDRLEDFFKMVPDAKVNLEAIKGSL